MPIIETDIDPQAVKYLRNAEYYSLDPYFSQRREDLYKLLERLEALPPNSHIPTKTVALICGLSAIYRQRFALLEHDPELSMSDKTMMLSTRQNEITDQLGIDQLEINLLKTLTLQVQLKDIPYYFLVCGTGNLRIDSTAKASLGPIIKNMLGVDNPPDKIMRRIRINPTEFNPIFELGLKPGIVSPFADWSHTRGSQRLSGLLCYMPRDKEGYLAIALSETDTLIVHHSVWRGALMSGDLNIPFR